MALKSGHRVVPLAFEEATKQYEQFQSYRSGTIRLDPDGWFFTTHYITYADKYHDFKFKSSDVVIMTYPKCGTTWTQEIVWTMMHNPNLNNAQATLPIVVRSPFLEVDFFLNGLPHNLAESSFLCDVFLQTHPNRNPKDGMFIQFAELAKEPRIIKTHLPFSLLAPNLPVTSKIIYMVRDPKDVAVSYCHHSKLMKAHDFVGTMSQFVDHFVNDTLIWGPFWKHVKEAWKKKHQFNVHFMYYEEMKANPKAEILRLQKFLNVNLTESQIDEMALKSGHRIIPVAFEEAIKQYEQFRCYQTGTIRLDPDGWFFTTHYITFADKYYDFKFKPSDVVIMTYPKCGTTWTQEIVWTMMHNPNWNNPKATLPIMVRSPFMEADFLLHAFPIDLAAPGSFLYDAFHQAHPTRNPKDGMFLQFAELTEDPRIIKTHLPFSLLSPSLPNTCKVIYVVRDPKDVAVSYFHHSRLMKGHDFVGTLSQFVDHFVNDTLLSSPFWKHVKEAWNKRNVDNIHFIFYEDMKSNPKVEILRLKNFLKVDLTISQINKIVHYTSFEEMKKREGENVMGSDRDHFINSDIENKDGGFFRKGITGDHKNELSPEDIMKINKWTKENTQDMEESFKYKQN